MKKLNKCLRLLRFYHQISLKGLSKKIKVSTSYLSEIETGKKKPTVEILGKYSKFFEIPASEISRWAEELEHDEKDVFGRGYSLSKAKGELFVFADIIRKGIVSYDNS